MFMPYDFFRQDLYSLRGSGVMVKKNRFQPGKKKVFFKVLKKDKKNIPTSEDRKKKKFV